MDEEGGQIQQNRTYPQNISVQCSLFIIFASLVEYLIRKTLGPITVVLNAFWLLGI